MLNQIANKSSEFSTKSLSNILRSIGTLSYYSSDVNKLVEELKHRLISNPDITAYPNLFSNIVNLKIFHVIPPSDMEQLLSDFIRLYQ